MKQIRKKGKHLKSNEEFYNEFFVRYKDIDLLKDKAGEYEFNKIIEQLDLRNKRNIIEFGCGVGRNVLALAKMGHKVTAVDVSQKGLDILWEQAKKHKLEKNITILCNDFSTPVINNTFDIAICVSTYQVVSEKEEGRVKILANFLASVKPGGTFLLTEPNPFNPLLYFFYLFYPGVQRRNIKYFLTSSPFRLKRILKNLGMEDIKIRYVGWLPLRFIRRAPFVITINEFINNTPLFNITSAFSYITSIKK